MEEPKRKLLQLAAEMALCAGMPSKYYEDWNWPKGMQVTSWRKVFDAAHKAELTCKDWSVELRKIYDSL